jgi:hypothetical protein
MSNKIDIDFVLSNVMDYCNVNPREYTYVAIGSCPHQPLDKLDDRWDQIIPKFVQDILDNTDETVRLISIDPAFEQKMDFMMAYHKSGKWQTKYALDFEYDGSDGMHIWRTKDHRVESIIICDNFHHKNRWNDMNNDKFFDRLVDSTIKYGNKLVVQEFTGHELDHLRRELYETCVDKEAFKKKILIDMTYGIDCHCGTDLTKFKPFYDEFFDFYNMTLFTEHEMLGFIGKDPNIDKHIKTYFTKKFHSTLNNIHVDYRRRVKGDPPLTGHKLYDATSSPEKIMDVLQHELGQILEILEVFQMVPPENKDKVHTLFTQYMEHDMYKWCDQVRSIIRV